MGIESTSVTGGKLDLPTIEDVARISAQQDPVLANLQITLAYHRISNALADLLGPTTNWCSHATRASKQAGQSIRGQDLERTFERLLTHSPEGRRKLSEVMGCLPWRRRQGGETAHRRQICRALRPLGILDRISDTISAGNRKVFDELGTLFVRFIETFRGDRQPEQAKLEQFCASLRPGEPPQGQGHLRAAFRGFHRAMFETRSTAKAQWVLLANLEVGFHEQIRLQPEIAAALDAPVVDPRELKRQLLAVVYPHLGPLRLAAGLYLRWATPIDRLWDPVVSHVRRTVRQATTELLMTLALPRRVLKLGHDVAAEHPESVREIVVPELLQVLSAIDPTPDSPRESGALDWADFGERMHFITDLFRSHIEDQSLLESPFDAEQITSILKGEIPSGRL